MISDDFRTEKARKRAVVILAEIYIGNRNVYEIEKTTDIPRQTVQTYINKLLDLGYLTTLKAQKRRKKKQVRLTQKGWEAISVDV